MEDRITYVGLDVHKEGIVVAVAEGGLRGEVRDYGRIANTPAALDRLMRKLGGEGVRLRVCYEAGPCGYGIQRHVSARGHECVVVAPSLIPKRAGDRVKTDRRDAAGLARGRADGGVGSGCHARGDARPGARPSGCGACAASSSPAAFGFPVAPGLPLRAAGLDQAASPLAGGAQVRASGASYCARGLHRGGRSHRGAARSADGTDQAMLSGWTLAPVVAALQTMRGMALVNAATLIAEVGDFSRFANPRQLMAYLGLVPSEHSSGARLRRAVASPKPATVRPAGC